MRQTTPLITVCFFSIAIATPVLGHQTALKSGWCSGDNEETSEVSYHQLEEQEILDFAAMFAKSQSNGLSKSIANGKSDAGFDHDGYSTSKSVADGVCAAEVEQSQAIFFGPETFLDDTPVVGTNTSMHHVAYSVKQGIEFGCYVCTAKSSLRK